MQKRQKVHPSQNLSPREPSGVSVFILISRHHGPCCPLNLDHSFNFASSGEILGFLASDHLPPKSGRPRRAVFFCLLLLNHPGTSTPSPGA